MKRFRAVKLAPEPKRIKRWRLIKAGTSRVLLAITPSGKSRAVKILKPIRRKP
jgi:hypothetical protein